MMRPKVIQWFLISQIASLAFGLYEILSDWDALSASTPGVPESAITAIVVVSYAINLALLFFIGWRRSNVARWIYIVLATIGLTSVIASFAMPTENTAILSSIIQFILGAAGIILLLIPAVSVWFSRGIDTDLDAFR